MGKMSARLTETFDRPIVRESSANFDGLPRLDRAVDSDIQLVDRIAQQGDQQALARLYERYEQTVFAVAHKVLRRETDAEEVVLHVFWRLWERPELYDAQRGSVVTYLVLLARSRALDKFRSLHSTKQPSAIVGDMDQDVQTTGGQATEPPSELVELQEQRENVQCALRKLSEVQRQALEMAFFVPLTHEQIARHLEVPLGTVKTRIRQGLIRLREDLRTLDRD